MCLPSAEEKGLVCKCDINIMLTVLEHFTNESELIKCTVINIWAFNHTLTYYC